MRVPQDKIDENRDVVELRFKQVFSTITESVWERRPMGKKLGLLVFWVILHAHMIRLLCPGLLAGGIACDAKYYRTGAL